MNSSSDQIETYKTPALFYDETCPLCLRFKQSLQRISLSQQIYYYPIQLKSIYPFFNRYYPEFTEEALKKEVHFITANGDLLKGSQVISHLSTLNKAVDKFSWLLESKMGQKAIDLFYKTSNRYRESLRKRCHQCNHD